MLGLFGILSLKETCCKRFYRALNCTSLFFIALTLSGVLIIKYSFMNDLKVEEKCKSNYFIESIN